MHRVSSNDFVLEKMSKQHPTNIYYANYRHSSDIAEH